MSKSIESINEEIGKIKNQIKELNLIINKKEDDLKNIINEKEEIITKMKNKILEQENIIKENKNEISNLNQKIEKIINNTTNELKNKEEKIIKIENNLSSLKKEKEEELDKLETNIIVQRSDMLNKLIKISNKFSDLNILKLKKTYNIAVFGECGVGKTQFCKYVARDINKSNYDNYNISSREFKKTAFTRMGIKFELIDTAGFEESIIFDNDNFFRYFDISNVDYIILIFSFYSIRITRSTKEFIEKLIKIFTPEKFFTHLCIVFTRYYLDETNEEKEILIKAYTKFLNDISKDKSNYDIKFYFVNTKFKENNFVFEKYQDTIDIMLKEIKLACNFS